MKSLWLADRLSRKRLARQTNEYLRHLSQEPMIASNRIGTELLARLRQEPGENVCLGETFWGEPVAIPLPELVTACALTTGGMGTGKSMFAALIIEALVRRLPDLADMAFGVLDAKGELFERALYLLAERCKVLNEREKEALLRRVVIVDFSGKDAVSPYNILARWQLTEPDYFVTSRLETLRELLPSGEQLSLRGTNVLKYALRLLSEFGLPLTYLDALLSSDTLRAKLLVQSQLEAVKAYFRHHFLQEGKQTIAALRTRMDALFASESVRLALAGSSAPDFRELQNQGKIVLVNCAGPTITRGVRLLLQGLVLADIRQAIFARPNNPPVTYLWFADEAQNFFLTRQQQENMADILTMARSFGSFFYFLCQNLCTAVPDARILETLYTNIRWSMTFRSTPRDALFLKAALPVTGHRERPEPSPFREPGVYSVGEEREIELQSIAHLPDRVGYLWLKARTPEAFKVKTQSLGLPEGEAFRRIVEAIRQDPGIGRRLSREDFERMIQERDRQWLTAEGETENLQDRMEEMYRRQDQL